MPLLDRFRSRPAWQSKDPEIRASAVRQLGPDQDAELLLAIAREDEDPRVRRLAVRKLADVAALGAIAREDADSGVRTEATSGLERLAWRARRRRRCRRSTPWATSGTWWRPRARPARPPCGARPWHA